MDKQIIDEKVSCDEHGCVKYTRFSDGSILAELITSEEAAQWEAENKF